MTAAIAIPITAMPAASAAQAGAAPSAGEGFAAALAELLGAGTSTAQPHAALHGSGKGQQAANTASTDTQADANAAVVAALVPTTTITPAANQNTINAQTPPAGTVLQALQAAQKAAALAAEGATSANAEQAKPANTPAAQAPASTLLSNSFAALAQASAQPTPTQSLTAKPAQKPATSKELSASAKQEASTNLAGTPGANAQANDKATATTQFANAMQHALSNNGEGNAQSGGAKADTTAQPSANASAVAFAIHTGTIDTTQASAPVATAQAAVPLDALAVHIARKFEAGESRFEIRLDPAGLGKLDISLTVGDDGRVQAVLRAERPETLDMLQRDARLLEGQLRQSGLNVDSNSLNFSLGGGNGQRPAFGDAAQPFANALNFAPETEPTITTTAIVSLRDGVDIRI